MKQLLRCLIPFLLAAAPASQALEVRFLAWDEPTAARQIAVAGGQGESAIKGLHPLQRTNAVGATLTEGNLTLRALDRKDVEGKAVDFAVKVGDAMTQPLVLLLPDAKAPSGLRGFAIEDNSTSFPWGTFRILNATGKPLEVALGTIREQLPPAWQPVDLRPGGNKALPVSLASTDAPRKPLYTGVWKPEDDVRRLVFVIPGTEARLGPLALKVIPEDRQSLAATGAP
jgi:hypothetical protein